MAPPKGRVIIDRNRCKGCALCVEVCPVGVLRMEEEINTKGYHPVFAAAAENCTGCTLCAMMCPDLCLVVERE
jgi:2-oxoglutarate ferredoxin oxidoreductase subunit delta